MKTNYAGHNRVYENLRHTDAVGWDKTDAAYHARFRDLAKVFGRLALPPRPRTLELGCGAGNISIWLAKKEFQVTGIDIAPEAISWARENAAREHCAISFLTGDLCLILQELPAEFDFVFDSHLLHCIIGNDRLPLLKQVCRVLKPGGMFLVDTMCGPVAEPEKISFCPVQKVCQVNGITTRYIGDLADIEQEMVTAGFVVEFAEVYDVEGNPTAFIACRKPQS